MQEVEKRGCIKSLITSSDNIVDLVNNLLTWSRLQINGIQVNKKRFNIKEVIRKNIELYKVMAHKKGIVILDYSKDLYVNADEDMILTVIRNLINNAVKFTREEGQIKIETFDYPDKVQIVVEDDGIGMNKEQIDNIYKLDLISHREGTCGEKGTGLGLILCKDFVEKNKGNIFIESQVNKGTKVIIELPKE